MNRIIRCVVAVLTACLSIQLFSALWMAAADITGVPWMAQARMGASAFFSVVGLAADLLLVAYFALLAAATRRKAPADGGNG